MPDDVANLVAAIASVGQAQSVHFDLREVEPFRGYHAVSGQLDGDALDTLDDTCSRREILLRYLLLSAVLDQGPDIQGVRALLASVTNELYRKGVRFLHRPASFFEDLGLAIDSILRHHESVKSMRAEDWAAANQSRASKYNLFMDNSRQALSYAVFRWGSPLAVPLMLERDSARPGSTSTGPAVLLGYLQKWKSAEIMSVQIKSNERYGLGKAIGNKACHLFAKWMVSTYRLATRDWPEWGDLSYELPYDSNAGRVLWRTGYLLRWATISDYQKAGVIQPAKGKGGADYIRVTNIRGMGVTTAIPPDLGEAYRQVVQRCLQTRQRFSKSHIHEMQHAYLYRMYDYTRLGVADLDDGLIYIGTAFCHNHSQPKCDRCPIQNLCVGAQRDASLIEKYRT